MDIPHQRSQLDVMTTNIVRISVSRNPDLNTSSSGCCDLSSEKGKYHPVRATYQSKTPKMLPFPHGWCEGKGEAEGRCRLRPPLHNKVASTATTWLQNGHVGGSQTENWTISDRKSFTWVCWWCTQCNSAFREGKRLVGWGRRGAEE